MKIKEILNISRPRFWLYEFGTFLAFGCIIGVQSAQGLLTLPVLIFGLYFLIPANILIYAINDVFDYETDKLNPKKVEYESLLVPEKHKSVYKWILAANLPFVVALPFLNVGWPATVSFALFIFCAFFYSVPPIRAKARPFLDALFSAGHYTATGFFGYYLVGGTGLNVYILALGLLWCIAMHVYSAVPDIKADMSAELATTATVLKKNRALLLCTAIYLILGILLYALKLNVLIVLVIPYLYLMYISFKTKTDDELFKIYKYFPTVNTLIGMFVSIYIILQRF